MRKRFSSELKARVALDMIRGQKTMAQISAEYGVHSTQLSNWKKDAIDSIKTIFVDGKRKEHDHTHEIDELYRHIGKLKVENEFLKKNISLI